jgi:hypothetical protein
VKKSCITLLRSSSYLPSLLVVFGLIFTGLLMFLEKVIQIVQPYVFLLYESFNRILLHKHWFPPIECTWYTAYLNNWAVQHVHYVHLLTLIKEKYHIYTNIGPTNKLHLTLVWGADMAQLKVVETDSCNF